MGRHAKTQKVLDAVVEILTADNPMTVRQVHYQLVSRQVTENTKGAYQALSRLLVQARHEGTIDWDWIEDRLRRPRTVSMWEDLADFAETAKAAYRKNVWETQPGYIECWLEKDALSGIFEDALDPYGVTLNVGRGFDSATSIKWASDRYREKADVAVLYFGDFDPSGEDMVRSLRERLAELGAEPEIVKCGLTRADIDRYQLPPDFAKSTDTRYAAFVEKHGDISVELDALPADVLRDRLVSEVEARMDLEALERIRQVEETERRKLDRLLRGAGRNGRGR